MSVHIRFSSSASRDVSFQQIRTSASPFPPVDPVAAPCGSPAVLHLRQYYGVVRLLPNPSALPPVDPWLHVPPTHFQRRSSWCERGWGALFGSLAHPVEHSLGSGPRRVGPAPAIIVVYTNS